MNAVATPTRPKAAPKRAKSAGSSEERDFIQGRDWAIRCLEEAQEHEDGQSKTTSRLRWVRKGEPQENFVLGWIADAVGGPPALNNHALRGFCAVMSDYLAKPASPIYPHAYQLPYAEYHKGEVGADGTRPTPPEMLEDDAAAKVEVSSAPEPGTCPHSMTAKQKDEMRGKMLQASALLELLIIVADHDGDDYDGMMGTLQFADRLLAELHKEIMEVDGDLPDDFRWRTFEAHAIVETAERLTFDTCWDRKSYNSSQLICWFDAANECLIRALRALEMVKEAPNA